MTPPCAIVWLRNDLRLHDNEALLAAAKKAAGGFLLPVTFLDPRQFGTTPAGFPKTGAHRTRFLLETLADLSASLRRLGSGLLVIAGRPEEFLHELAKKHRASAIYYHKEITSEETTVERAVGRTLETTDIRLVGFHGSWLYHPDDLPFDSPQDFPDVFTNYRKEVEKRASVRVPESAPIKLPPLPSGVVLGQLPEVHHLGLEAPPVDDRAVLPFAGGESEAIRRMEHYFWETGCLAEYKETRNGLLGANYSSKFSPWLAVGALSPRLIFSEVRRFEKQRVSNSSTYWLIFELIWRDFFRAMALKYGNRIFKAGGMRRKRVEGRDDRKLLTAWIEGRTGYPFVDANMRELARTGFMSNRGRQNVASFLVRDLGVHWRLGAEYFESLLIDYDACSNWGNWNYVSGVGNDPREDRYFNVLKQASNYDAGGDYVRHWIPELAAIRDGRVHEPWRLTGDERRAISRYPAPVVRLRAAR